MLKSYLIDKIRKEKMIKEARDHNIATNYNDLSAEWKRRVEKVKFESYYETTVHVKVINCDAK